MFQSIRIAVRNITRQKKRSILLGSAVAFGFLVISLVNGFTAGIVGTTKENFAHTFGGHIYITGSSVSRMGSEISLIADDKAAEKAIASLGTKVASVHHRSGVNGTMYFGTNNRSIKLEGVDFADEGDFASSVEISRGSLADIGKEGSLILPDDTAKKLGAEIGETVIYKASTITGQQNVGEFTLIATTVSGGLLPIETGYTGKAVLNALIGLDASSFQKINVYLKDVEGVNAAAAGIYAALAREAPVESRISDDQGGGISMMKRMMGMGSVKSVAKADQWTGTKFALTTIEDIMKPVMSLVTILNTIAFAVFIVLLLIIGVGILNSYRMIMIERTSEIGTMRAIGVQKKGIRDIFLFEAVTVSAAGALAGFVLALIVSAILSLVNFGNASIFSVFLAKGHFAFSLSVLDSLTNLLILCVMSLAAVYLPARKAANLLPAEALRASY